MDSNIKTLLIILAFVSVTIIVFMPFYSCDSSDSNLTECYDASFDWKYANPRTNPYSKNITYRPDADSTYTIDDPVNSDPYKLFDYLSDQEMGVNPIDDTIDTDPKDYTANLSGEPLNQRIRDLRRIHWYEDRGLKVPTKKPKKKSMRKSMRYSMENPMGNPMRKSRRKSMRNPMTSSYTDTEINEDVVNESNNIARYCEPTLYQGQASRQKQGQGYGQGYSDLISGIDKPYALSNNLKGSGIDINQRQYYDLNTSNPKKKSYTQIDDDFSLFNKNTNPGNPGNPGNVKDVNGLQELTQVMDTYRNDRLCTISNNYC